MGSSDPVRAGHSPVPSERVSSSHRGRREAGSREEEEDRQEAASAAAASSSAASASVSVAAAAAVRKAADAAAASAAAATASSATVRCRGPTGGVAAGSRWSPPRAWERREAGEEAAEAKLPLRARGCPGARSKAAPRRQPFSRGASGSSGDAEKEPGAEASAELRRHFGALLPPPPPFFAVPRLLLPPPPPLLPTLDQGFYYWLGLAKHNGVLMGDSTSRRSIIVSRLPIFRRSINRKHDS
ncbi:PREDICTED: probable fibrosin-1, partial [Thamnophis sirtalis]|uniref:Probable fibrosin-1 n=1 Tax=Thamnophis sirtalis TaxID=35019 RepID=A0A6I9X5X2_9SAUR